MLAWHVPYLGWTRLPADVSEFNAIDYVCLHLERSRPDVLTVRMSCEHPRTDFEGPFFSALLIAAGQALNTSITNKRQELGTLKRETGLAGSRVTLLLPLSDEIASCDGWAHARLVA
jgi:hypothetical protein